MVILLTKVEERYASEYQDTNHQGRSANQGQDGQVEGKGVILKPGFQVHPEHGREASSKGQAKHAHLDEETHPDDPVPGLKVNLVNLDSILGQFNIKN